jgi:hypothetical protein
MNDGIYSLPSAEDIYINLTPSLSYSRIYYQTQVQHNYNTNTTEIRHTKHTSKQHYNTMCQWIFWTGSACAHQGAEDDGTPIPSPEEFFMQHGVWKAIKCREFDRRRQWCPMPPYPTYDEMTADMQNYGYALMEEGKDIRGNLDFRCPKCRGVDPLTNRPIGYSRAR